MERHPTGRTLASELNVLFNAGAIGALSDRELLGLFEDGEGDLPQRAFEVLVHRHGPMVLGVCRRALRDPHLAEDVFQATFLILSLKAHRIRKPDSLGPWLHCVAIRVARRARRGRLPKLESINPSLDVAEPSNEPDRGDFLAALDEEIGKLPAAYRKSIVLCYLEGNTQQEAAKVLGWSKGTVSGRLARAKDMLRVRLTRRGLAPATASLSDLSGDSLSAAVPATLATATVRAAHGLAIGRMETITASTAIATLVREGVWAMALSQLKTITAIALLTTMLAAGVIWTGAGLAASGPSDEARKPESVRPKVLRVSQPAKPEPRELPLPKGARLRLGTTRLRHGDHVRGVDYSPDGKEIASASNDGTVRFWKASTGMPATGFPTLPVERGACRVAYSPDGTKLVIGDNRGWVRIWDLVRGREVFAKKGHNDHVVGLTVASDGKSFATASCDDDPFVRIWDLDSGGEVQTLRTGLKGLYKWPLAFSPDGKKLALGGWISAGHDTERGGAVYIWDLNASEKPVVIRIPKARDVSGLVFLPDGTTLISASMWPEPNPSTKDKSSYVPHIQFWDARSGAYLRELTLSNLQGMYGIGLSRDGKLMVSAHSDRLAVWEMPAGKIRRIIPVDIDSLFLSHNDLSFSPDNKFVAVTRGDNVVHLWGLTTGEAISSNRGVHFQEIRSIAISSDGRSLATGSSDGAIHLWDAAMAKHVSRLEMAEIGPINHLQFSPDGHSFAASSEYLDHDLRKIVGTVRIWDMAGGTVRHDLKIDNRGGVIAFSPDGLHLAVADSNMGGGPRNDDPRKDYSIQIFEVSSGKQMTDLQGHTKNIVAMGYSPDGKQMVSAAEDNTIRFWDLTTCRETRQITIDGHDGQPSRIFQASIAPDLERAVTSGFRDDRLIVWDMKSGKAQYRSLLAKNRGALVAFAPNGRIFASASTLYNNPKGDDWTIRLWDAVDGREILQLDPQGLRVTVMTFTPDGKSLVTGMNDTTTLVWDISGAYDQSATKKLN